MSEPSQADAAWCLELRCRSKRGIHLSILDHAFCERIFQEHPEWYKTTASIVFNRTAPFGAVQQEVTP